MTRNGGLVVFALLLTVQSGWTLAWLTMEQSSRSLTTRQLASVLAPEVLMDGKRSPLWLRLSSLPQVNGGQLLAPDGSARDSFGSQTGPSSESVLVEAGQVVGTLRVHYQPSSHAWALAGSWAFLLAGLVGWSFRARHPVTRACLPSKGPVLVELDGDQRVLQIRGDSEGLESPITVGQPLSESAKNQLPPGVGTPEGRPSLVVVRDTKSWEGLQRRVQELKDQYRSLCDFAQDLILVSQPEGLLIFANKAILKLHPELEVGTDIWHLFQPDSQEIAQRQFRHCILEGETRSFNAVMAIPGSHAIHVQGSFCPGVVDSGVAVTVLGIFRDLTQQIRAEEDLRQAQKMEAVGRLAGGVAHDFNNLLTVMGSVSSLVRFEPEESPDRWEHLDLLDETVERAAQLTRQLLLFSRKQSPTCSPLSVDTVLTDLLRMAARLLGEDIALEADFQSGCWILADSSELEQIAMNLLVNARDAMPEGGRMDVSSRSCEWSGGPAVELQFRDTGCGMSDELVRRIFEPYFTTKEVGKGTGLGLSTTYAIVTRLRGSVTVSSRPGQGTTFTIHLPAIDEPQLTPAGPVKSTPRSAGDSVLLVEDEVSLCHATTRTLQLLGYDVTSKVSPLDALSWLEDSDNCPGILVTDLIMPGMNGAELARKARQIHPNLKVLFVSGYPGQTLDALDEASMEFMPKPYRGEELSRRIREILDLPGFTP